MLMRRQSMSVTRRTAVSSPDTFSLLVNYAPRTWYGQQLLTNPEGIGGTIGTALFVSIGRGVLNGGPGSLFIAFTLWYGPLNHHGLILPGLRS